MPLQTHSGCIVSIVYFIRFLFEIQSCSLSGSKPKPKGQRSQAEAHNTDTLSSVSLKLNIDTMSLQMSFNSSTVDRILRNITTFPAKPEKYISKAKSEASESKPAAGLPIDLTGKRAFIAGVADDNGYGWAIAKSLFAAGAEILVGTWVPALNIFETSLRRGKFDESRRFPDGSLMEITKIYPLDAVFDNPEDIKANKRYAGSTNWTVQEAAQSVKEDFGNIDILVHSLANGPEAYLCRFIQVLAFEAGRKHKIRVNTISAGPLRSRAAKAIGFIDTMIEYSLANAPLQKELSADEVGNTAAFLASPLASAITGAVIYVDNGLNAMGVGVDSPLFKDLDIPKDKH
ncbi:hypothetical protein RJ639_019824 [Escallonia herrerae]|uniref:Uncharacterized protein n=1 Tax=Escallonia herrerae TaxID=1293975 RepID=A0AA89AJW7_9ASTE|nr:hypothetical protein RJ639_019824 [Escallonia herrerae]